jgi:hypothetical protein
MSGFRTWTPNEIITASNVQNYLQDQTVMVFPSSAVRATAIPVATEGMLSWLEDGNKYQYYTGSAWADLITPITGGTLGQAYVAQGGTAAAAFGDVKAEFIATTVTEKTANYTIQASDIGTIIQTTGTANITLTIPDVFQTGDSVQFIRDGSGSAIISAGTGVTSWAGIGTAGTGLSFYIDTRYSAAAVIKTDSNEYRVIGRVSV